MEGAPVVERLRLRGVPMMAAALCFAAGDALALRWQATAYLVAACGLLAVLTLVAMRYATRVMALPVLGLWVAVGCWCGQMELPVSPQHELTSYADGLSRTVRGRVVRVRMLPSQHAPSAVPEEGLEPWEMEPGAWETESGPVTESVDVAVDAVEDVTPDVASMRGVAGGVRLTVIGDPVELSCGDMVEVPLRLRVPDVYRDPGVWSHADELLGEGIGAQASVKSTRVQRVGRGEGGWKCRLSAVQTWAAQRMDAMVTSRANTMMPRVMRLTVQDAAMLDAMLFGDRAGLNQPLRVGFERTGTFHLFVVSGMHIVLLAGGIFWGLRKTRAPEGVAVMVTIALATAYALLTGFGVPVQRALGMTAVYLVARWLAREAGALNALGTAALAALVLDPRALFTASFQMTLLVIVAVAGMAAPLAKRAFGGWKSAVRNLDVVRIDTLVEPRIAQLRVRLRMFSGLCETLLGMRARNLPSWLLRAVIAVGEALLLTVVTEICMCLPMAVYFHRATLLALPVNLIAVPAIAALMCCAVVMFCLSLVSAWIAIVPGIFAAILLHVVGGVVGVLSRVRLADVRVPGPDWVVVGVVCGLMVLAVVGLRTAWWRVAVLGVMLIPLLVLWPERPLVRAGVLEVTALDVGQGDSLLVVSPGGRTLLVDAGGPVGIAGRAAKADQWDVGEEVVAPYLWWRRIRRLDAVLLTHAHSDHMGGMPAVLRDMRPRELWLSVEPGEAPELRALLAEAQELGIAVRWFRAGDGFAWGGLRASVLAPEASYVNPKTAVNNDSLVMRLEYGKASVLLEGDAEAPSEAAMVANGRVSPATLLKVGHHGSKTSTTDGFLSAVAPREAVISVGRHNTFGHPRYEVLERLENSGVKTFRTDREGAETFWLAKDGGIEAMSGAQ